VSRLTGWRTSWWASRRSSRQSQRSWSKPLLRCRATSSLPVLIKILPVLNTSGPYPFFDYYHLRSLPNCLEKVINSSQIHSPWLGDIVDSGIGLFYRPANLCILAGRNDNPIPEVTLFPQSGTMNLATGPLFQRQNWLLHYIFVYKKVYC
jgi:hypothetical protein